MTRWPFAPLEPYLPDDPVSAAGLLGVSVRTLFRYKAAGVPSRAADRVAVAAGVHPFEVWPEMADQAVADARRRCLECGTEFVPRRSNHKFCTYRCGARAADRRYKRLRYQSDPEFRRKAIERSRAAREAMGPAAKRKEAERLRRYRKPVRLPVQRWSDAPCAVCGAPVGPVQPRGRVPVRCVDHRYHKQQARREAA